MSELDSLRKAHQALRAKHEQAETKVSEFRDRLRETRQELGTKDRQLEVAKRMLERISNDKSRAEAASEHGKLQVRKLEARLTQPGDLPSDLSAKAARLQSKLAEQKEQTSQMEARMLLAEETSLQLSQEVHVLKRALGLKKSLASEAIDGHAKLLQQLAQSQEESAALAMQLAQGERAMQDLREKLEASSSKMQQLQQANAESDARLIETQQQVSEALQNAAVFRQEAELTRSQLMRVQASLEAESAARVRAEQQTALQVGKVQQVTERLQSVERANRLSIEALRSEVTLAVERAESRAAEQRANAAVKEAHNTDQFLTLQRSLEAAKAELQLEKEQHGAETARLKQQLEMLQDELNRLKQAEREYMMECGRIQGQLENASDVNKGLQARLQSFEDRDARNSGYTQNMALELDLERQSNSKLKSQVDVLNAQLSALVDSRVSREQELEAQVEALKHEAAVGSATAAKLQTDYLTARRQLSLSSKQSNQADQYVEELHNTIAALTESKNKLQSYMLEQLAVFKTKLQRAESDNQQLRAAMAPTQPVQPYAASIDGDSSDGEYRLSSSISVTAGFGLAARSQSRLHSRSRESESTEPEEGSRLGKQNGDGDWY